MRSYFMYKQFFKFSFIKSLDLYRDPCLDLHYPKMLDLDPDAEMDPNTDFSQTFSISENITTLSFFLL